MSVANSCHLATILAITDMLSLSAHANIVMFDNEDTVLFLIPFLECSEHVSVIIAYYCSQIVPHSLSVDFKPTHRSCTSTKAKELTYFLYIVVKHTHRESKSAHHFVPATLLP